MWPYLRERAMRVGLRELVGLAGSTTGLGGAVSRLIADYISLVGGSLRVALRAAVCVRRYASGTTGSPRAAPSGSPSKGLRRCAKPFPNATRRGPRNGRNAPKRVGGAPHPATASPVPAVQRAHHPEQPPHPFCTGAAHTPFPFPCTLFSRPQTAVPPGQGKPGPPFLRSIRCWRPDRRPGTW